MLVNVLCVKGVVLLEKGVVNVLVIPCSVQFGTVYPILGNLRNQKVQMSPRRVLFSYLTRVVRGCLIYLILQEIG